MFFPFLYCMSDEKGKVYSHIVKYTSLFGSIQVLNIAVGLLRNKLVAVILGPVGMGLASLFNSTIQLLCNTVNLGIPMSGVREVATSHESGDRSELLRAIAAIRKVSLITAIIGMLLCVVLAKQLDSWTFSWGDHSLHFMLLSPAIGLTIVAGGEIAILKGLKRLRALAQISVYQVIAVFFISVPLYYVWGQMMIVPVIILTALSQLVLAIWTSYRLFPPFAKVEGSIPVKNLIRLGSAFVVSGVMASGADFIIRTYLNNVSVEEVGLFNSGFVLINLYAGMVFASMETDYYPRLSSRIQGGIQKDKGRYLMVNEQIEMTLLMVAPMLVGLMIFMPIVMPLLYSSEFVPVITMVQVSLLAIYFRAAYLPVEYIALASGRSRLYLVQESISAVLLAVFVIAGYSLWGLWGAGVGLVVAYLLELVFVLCYSYRYFGFVISRDSLAILLVQLLFAILTYAVVSQTTGLAYWGGGAVCVLLSAMYSLYRYRNSQRQDKQ